MNSKLIENDIALVRGQYHVARALEVAAAGRHNILLLGSPGVGKALLARVLPTFLPAGEAQLFEPQPEEEESIPDAGVLFLRDVQRWTVGELTRVWVGKGRQMIATCTYCPCGFYGDPIIECTCPAQRLLHYQRKRAPFLNVFDIHVEVPPLKAEELLENRKRESSEAVRLRVVQARKRQEQRGKTSNSILTHISDLQQGLDPAAERLLQAALHQLQLGPQAVVQMLRLARTLADLAETQAIMAPSLAEAIQYRSRFRRG